MLQASLLTDHHFPLDKHQLILVGGDGATWIKEGAKDYFPNSLYQLCPFHLERRLTQTLSYNSIRHSHINRLLKEGKIPEALTILEEDRERYPKKTKELEELIIYFINNHEGINTVDVLKGKGLPVDTMGAIGGNIDEIPSNRFKKRGMSWSTSGALNLAKIGQLIINGTWDDWWTKHDDVIIKEIEPEEKVYLLQRR